MTQRRKHTAHKGNIRRVLKEKMGKRSNAWPVYWKYRQLVCEEDILLCLSRDLKAETGSGIIAAQDRRCKPNIMQQKY
jgi:hypothetical protein